MAPSPTPVGCEQLPVTEGSFREDKTKAKAPAIARSMIALGCALTVFLMVIKPASIIGLVISPHEIHQSAGKNPSIICMAYVGCGISMNVTARLIIRIFLDIKITSFPK
jgi:hypothetical protein